MAKIKLDLDRQRGKINSNIYGNFIEHLGRCIYGGIYDEESPLSDKNNIRQDVLEAAKDLNIPHLRWPGGNFVSGYHWMDGIGPVEERPNKQELAWDTVETNKFGTDEYMEYCELLDTEPHLCVNMGNGTMEEAQNWVEYCNADTDTKYANLRRQYGQEEPYDVKYWGLGNEIYGEWQIGHKDVHDYVKAAKEFGKVMKRVDPSIELIACGAGTPEWDRVVVEELGGLVDYISTHMYVGNPDNDYYDYMATSEKVERRLEMLEGIINSVMHDVAPSERPKIAFDEWNVWYRTHPDPGEDPSYETRHILEEHYNQEDALVVAMFLNSFTRHCDSVKMANLAQLVNVIAPMMTKKEDLFKQTIYYPLYLYANHNKEIGLRAYTQCGSYEARETTINYLDVSASSDIEEEEVVLNVINRRKEETVSAEIESQKGSFHDQVEIYELSGEGIKDKNSFQQKDKVTVEEKRIDAGNPLEYDFPPHSLTVMTLPVSK